MKHKANSKITRSHTTVTDAAGECVDLLVSLPEIKKISLGVIKNTPGSGKGHTSSLKIVAEEHSMIFNITAGASNQKIRVYPNNMAQDLPIVSEKFGSWCKNKGWRFTLTTN